MKHKGIRRTLLLSHVGVAVISLLVILVLVNGAVYVTFDKYMKIQQEAEAEAIVKELEAAYRQDEGWPISVLMTITHREMLRSFAYRLNDARGQVVWDSSNMIGHFPGMNPGSTGAQSTMKYVFSLPIEKEGQTIGTVSIAATGGLFPDQERAFLIRVNLYIGLALLIVLIGVYGFSRRLSVQISRPLLEIKEVANQMKNGDLQVRVQTAGGQQEIVEVGLALNHLAESLQKQEQLRKGMTADIAHELRTPLATVRSHLEAFMDGIWEPTMEKMERCHVQVMRLVYLIQDLEKLAEAENPMILLDKEAVNLIAIIQEAYAAVQERSMEKQIHYTGPYQDEILLNGDSKRLLQVFINLLDNAVKYTPEHGEVEVNITEEADHVCIHIHDTGVGISSEERWLIFERFYRGEKSRSRALGGAGIGLAVVKAIVEAHGGRISAHSRPHGGTTFTVLLPKK